MRLAHHLGNSMPCVLPATARCTLVLLATAASSASASGPEGGENNAASKLQLPTDEYFDEYGSLYDHIGMLQVFARREHLSCVATPP
jgi:hypothetical protein